MIAALALIALTAQQPPPELARRIAQVHEAYARLGRDLGDSIWPGFRPDTIPVLYVVPDTGTLLFGWRGAPPAGFVAIAATSGAAWQPVAARGAASTGTTLDNRPTAQLVVSGADSQALVAALAIHEAFHVFQGAVRREGRRFGKGENAFLVSTYPVFDSSNEANWALEGRVLAAALAAPAASRRDLVRQFLAVRETRHRALPSELAEFEQLAELNEGLAQYAQVRALGLLSATAPSIDSALATLTKDVRRSIRLRFYATGPAQAKLLDALEGAQWKARLVRDDLTLQDALAVASGYRDVEKQLIESAARRHDLPTLRVAAEAAVADLRGLRAAQVDSIVRAPGVLLVVSLDSLPGRRTGLCLIDPQNLLQVDSRVQLHTRMVRTCAGAALDATFTTATVLDREAATVRAVIGPVDSITVTVAGKPLVLRDGSEQLGATDVRIESPRLTLTSRRADLVMRGRVLTIRPKP